MTTTDMREASPRVRLWLRSSGYWYAGAVVVGAVLIVLAAINQPFNQNELQQIKPYGSDSVERITSATRQPPLGPLLGAAFQHLLGEGQLRQRLVPVLAGIGALTVTALLFRRLHLGAAGAVGVWVMATAPLMLRFSAYTRPYMLPMFLMLVFVYATQRWIDDRGRGWLVLAALSVVALPLARVPEPTVFLLTVPVVLAWFAFRKRFSWSQVLPIIVLDLGALAFVGYPMYRTLATEASSVYDPSISGIVSRFDRGVEEIVASLIPLLGSWFPWWPITVLAVIAALVLPSSRRRLAGWWFLWPLLAAPVAFVLAYHFLNPFSFDVRPYRPRVATFFLPAYVFAVVALATVVADTKAVSRRLRVGVGVLLCAAMLSQLPASARVLRENHAADFGQVGEVLTEELPDDAIVLYDVASRVGMWRQPFSAKPRYMGDTPYVGQVFRIMKRPRTVPRNGPVYMLLLDSECAFSVVCTEPRLEWDHKVQGWHVEKRFDKFTLFASDQPASGLTGVIEATTAFGDAMGPRIGYPHYFTAASLLKVQGREAQGRALLERMYEEADPQVARAIRNYAERKNWNPFL